MKAFGHEWTNAMDGGRVIDRQRPWMRFDSEAVWTDSNGNINLGIRTSPKDVRHWDGKTYKTKYAVGVMRSVDTFSHGRFTAEIQLPKGRNLWPSFWLVGDGRWPDNGEIDIMEAWSDGKGSYFRPTIPQFPYLVPGWKTTNNTHFLVDGMHGYTGTRNVPWCKQPKNPSENFIRYEVEWRPNNVIFRVNGNVTRQYGWNVAQHLIGKRMHVIFNLWTDSEDFTLDTPMVIKSFSYKPS